ncbi:putative Peptidyl-prolyl cis-trans isomerase [Desulfovibrionales bacterium]
MNTERYIATRLRLRLPVLLLLLWCIPGCNYPEQPGVVARVNGTPITLRQLQSRYDLTQLCWATPTFPSVSRLKEEYGLVLAELIIQELVRQDLNRRGLAVTEEELNQAEARIRADYPKGIFERMLEDEFLDLTSWREQLSGSVALEKLRVRVLQLKADLGFREGEAFFLTHKKKLQQPDRWRFVVLSSPDRKDLDIAVESYKGHGVVVESANVGKDAQINLTVRTSQQEFVLPVERILPAWRKILASLQPGQSSSIMTAKDGFEALVLLEKFHEIFVYPYDSYVQAEHIPMEQQVRQAFEDWLRAALVESDVRIHEQLIPGQAEEGEEMVESANQIEEGAMELIENDGKDVDDNGTVGNVNILP